MRITIVGTGFIGGVLGRALAASGQDVTFASRHPDDDDVAASTQAAVAPVGDALGSAEVIVLAVPGAAVRELTKAHAGALAGKLVIDATNQMSEAVANARASLPASIRYARAFNTLGGENMAEPVFPGGQQADMFFSAPEEDRSTMEAVISGVGLRPIYVGQDQEALIDAVFHLWVALAFKQGRGRRTALKLLEG
jgi:hypothetical protein